MSFIYKSPRPRLTIDLVDSQQLGRCYSSCTHKITTALYPLNDVQINLLKEAGLIGCGQEFYIRSPHGGNEQPAGMDSYQCVDEKTGQPAINERTGEPFPNISRPYYEYLIETRVDSSD